MRDVMARSDAADVCKALGIILVVWGHAPGLSTTITTLIYSFHMPLFFFVSGYLLKAEKLTLPLNRQFRGMARALLVPYLFFFILSLAYWLATRNVGSKAGKFEGITLIDAFEGLFSGLSSDLFVNPTLWFFPCMFVAQAIYRMLWQVVPHAAWIAAITLLAASAVLSLTYPWDFRLPWGLDIVWIALVFFSLGQYLRTMRAAPRTTKFTQSSWQISALFALIGIWFGCSLWQGRVDLADANFGPHIPVYFLNAFLGIAITWLISRHIPPGKVLRWIAQNTLLIFPLHPLFINFGSGVVKLLGVAHYGWEASVLFSAFGIACTVPAVWFIRRYLPTMVGMPTSPRAISP